MKASQTSKTFSSLKRFMSFVWPYYGWITAAIVTGIVRYLIPLVMPWTLKIIVDDFLKPGATAKTFHLDILMTGLIGLYLLHASASYLRSYLAGLAGHNIIFDLRQKLYLYLQRMSLGFFDRQKIGSVVSHMTNDIASAQNFVGSALINTAMDMACLAAIIVLLLAMHWKLALVSMSVLPFYAVFNFRLTKHIKAKSRDIHDQMQEMSGDLHEQFAGISTIQSFTREEMVAGEFKKQSEKFLDAMIANLKLQSLALAVTNFLTAVGPIFVLWFGVHEVWAGRLSTGTLMAFYAYLGLLYQPIQRLADLTLVLVNSLAAMDRIFTVFDIYPEVREIPKARKLRRIRGHIRFEDAGFEYENGDAILSHLNLEIPAGMTAALVGPSGAGKTTLVKLLPRFYDVTRGRILIDGFDIRQVTLKSLRKQIAIVSQDPILFSGSILENLRYGDPEADLAKIRKAARAAFAEMFIEKLPQGYATEIGERGVKLSGGQKQRLALARAFLKNAPIVILDEPTSALDPESEDLIKQALERMLENRTALIIAHRLSTIEHADKVVVIDRGKVLEEGRHEDLLKSESGIYRRYAAKQHSIHSLPGK